MQTTLNSKHYISSLDKMMLKEILSSNKKLTSAFLSEKLKTPITTIQRGRTRLEKVFLDKEYILSLEKFGMRGVDFFISTINGKTDEVAKVLFNLRQVIFVGKSIGQHAIGLSTNYC